MIVFFQEVDSKISTLGFGVPFVSAFISDYEGSAPQELSYTRLGHHYEELGSRQHNPYPALGHTFRNQLIISILSALSKHSITRDH